MGQRTAAWVIATLVLGLGLSTVAAWHQSESNREQTQEAFAAVSEELAAQLTARMRLYEYGVRGARGVAVIAGEQGMSRRLFQVYSQTRDIDREFPGARGFGFIRRVPADQVEAFLARARAEGPSSFSIHQIGPNPGERLVIQYIEPLERNGPAIGLDIASEPNRRGAALTGMATGKPTLTGPITLVQVSGERQRSLLLLLPIYRAGAPLDTLAQRDAATMGWSYAALSLKEVLTDFRLARRPFDVVLRDVTSPGQPESLFDSSILRASPAKLSGPRLVMTREMHGRLWEIELRAHDKFVQDLRQLHPSTVFLTGALTTLLLSTLLGVVQRSRESERRHAIHQAQLATIVENSADAIIGEGMDGKVIAWNQAATRLFGFSEREALGRPLSDLLLGPDQRDEDSALLHRIAAGETLPPFDAVRVHQDGTPIDVSITAGAMRSANGSIVGVAKLIRDVRDRKEYERHLRDFSVRLEREVRERTAELDTARRDLQTVLDAVPSMIGYWDQDLRNRVANRAYEHWFAVRLPEVRGMHMRDLLGPELFEMNRAFIEGALRGETQQFEREIPRPEGGAPRYSLTQYLPDIQDGEVRGFYVIAHDITAVKSAENELQRVVALLGSVLRAATEVSIIATDAEGLITVFNAGAERMLGYTAAEMVGRQTPAILHLPQEVQARGEALSAEHGEPITGFQVFTHRAAREGAETREWTYVRRDGSHLAVLLVVTAIRNDAGEIMGYLGIAQDMTERHRVEAALREAKVQAEAASQAKSLFLANMSHEIRTPMNAVIGVAHLLSETPLDQDQRQLLAKLQIAGRSLLGIINDVLDLSKIEAGEMQIDPEVFNPGLLLSEIEQLFAPQTHDKGLALEFVGVSTLPARIEGDATRLRQILVNLLSNAIKFTEKGKVEVEVAQESPGEGPLWLRWTVSDTGCGIAPEALDRLFAPFMQADASTTRRHGGTGLGLSIVRRFAEMMGGQVGVSSTPGQGSQFWVRLPFRVVDPQGAPSQADERHGLEVVVVDDDPGDRRALGDICRALGWRTSELPSGLALTERFDLLSRQGQPLPDALLVDWRMPGLDGLEALGELARMIRPGRLPAALIVSSHERETIEALDHAHLVDHILTKPVNASELFDAVNTSIATHTGSTDRVARSTLMDAVDGPWLQGVRILLVDDSDINLDVARRILHKQGAVVQICMNGLEALDHLRAAPSGFDAVLMDVQMPVMDGYEATRLMRTELGLTQLPVLALTAGAVKEERRRAEDAGMTDFLTKPLHPPALVQAVRRAVERARGEPLRLVQPEPGPRAGAPEWPAIAGIDGPDAALRLGGDAALFLRLLARLLEETDVRAWLQPPSDRPALAAGLHKLRGSAGLLGAKEVYRLASQAEAAARGVAPDEALASLLQDLNRAWQALAQAATPVLAAHQNAADAAHEDEQAPALSDHDLERLAKLLAARDLSAVDEVRERRAALRKAWGPQETDRFIRAVDELDFAHALDLLRALRATPPSPR